MQSVEPGLGDPEALSEHQARCREWDPIRAVHQGQRSSVPHEQAAHMTAPDRLAEPLNKTLAQRGRPHMPIPEVEASPACFASRAFWSCTDSGVLLPG